MSSMCTTRPAPDGRMTAKAGVLSANCAKAETGIKKSNRIELILVNMRVLLVKIRPEIPQAI